MGFLVSKLAQARVEALVADFVRACPPESCVVTPAKGVARSQQIVTPQAAEAALTTLCTEAFEYVRTQRLGILRRAAFARAAQKRLMGAGYPMDIVSRIVNALTVSALVSGRSDSATPQR